MNRHLSRGFSATPVTFGVVPLKVIHFFLVCAWLLIGAPALASDLGPLRASAQQSQSTTRFVKIANDGSELPGSAVLGPNAKDWACTKDTETGLIWEVKTEDGGLRDWHWRFLSYDPKYATDDVYSGDPYVNWGLTSYGKDGTWGGITGPSKGSPCNYVLSQCNTDSYAKTVNQLGLCGLKNWIVPSKDNLEKISCQRGKTSCSTYGFFENTNYQYYYHWSSSIFDNSLPPLTEMWYVDIYYSHIGHFYRSSANYVRLVNDGKTSPPPDKQKVVLLLHGMNSMPKTWDKLVSGYFINCPNIYNGEINSTATPNAQKTYCYRIKFGYFDANSQDKGLEDAWEYGESTGHASAGDYSSFDQLGTEIDKAISSIKKALPSAKILLIGHSRGGLAARAFLQNAASGENKKNIVGLITTGTPHNGTRLGRVYGYIESKLLKSDGSRTTDTDSTDDWQAIDLLRAKRTCNGATNPSFLDARRPVIGYLADNSSMLGSLNIGKSNLPAIEYGALVYKDVYLGKLGLVYDQGLNYEVAYNLFDETGADICDQVSSRAEAFIKGGTADAPTPSSNYSGDGIVTGKSQDPVLSGEAVLQYSMGILHTEEPTRTSHIATMACKLGFSYLEKCPAPDQATAPKAVKASEVEPGGIVSHDYDALVTLTIGRLWQNWSAVATDADKAEQRDRLAVALGIKLRSSNDDNAAFYASIEQRLLSLRAPQLERARIAGLLAEIATPPAVEVLTHSMGQMGTSDIQAALTNAIIDSAGYLPEYPRRANLSAVLERAWLNQDLTKQQIDALALSIAELGTASGVELLLTAVDNVGTSLPSVRQTSPGVAERKALAAFAATGKIINADSQAVLTQAFTMHRATEAVFVAAGNGLVNLGKPDAALLVLQRLNELPDNALSVGLGWLNTLSGTLDKSVLRELVKTAGMPRQQALQKQIETLLQ